MENGHRNENQTPNITNMSEDAYTKKPLRVSDLIHGLRRHVVLIVVCGVIGLALGIVLSVVSYMRGEMSKQYAVKTTIGVTSQNKNGLFTTQTSNPSNLDIHLAEDMVDAVIYVLKSDKMLNKVIDKTQLLGISTKDISDNLVLTQYNDTQIIDITLYWRSAQEGVEILQAFNDCASDVLIETLKIGEVTVINDPKARYLIGGNLNAALWGYMMVFGIVMGIGIAILDLLIRPTLLSVHDMERDFHIEVLGQIPENKKYFELKKDILNSSEEDEVNSEILDNYMSIAQILKRRLQNMEHPGVYVTSAAQNEGKTTVTAYLAAYLAELGAKVLLIDLDTRNPKLGGLFLGKVEYENSINALYRGESTKVDAICHLNPKLDILPAVLERKYLPFDSALLDMIKNLKAEYDVVLMDTAPVGQVADTMSLNELADLCLLVVRFDGASTKVIREAVGRLDKTGVRIMGCVVNGVKGFGNDRRGYYSDSYGKKGFLRKPNRKSEKSVRKQEWEKWEEEHKE